MFSQAWDSPLVVDGKVYVGDEDGDITIFKHGTEKKLLHEHYMENSVKSASIVANNVLYITTNQMLYAIEQSKPLRMGWDGIRTIAFQHQELS